MVPLHRWVMRSFIWGEVSAWFPVHGMPIAITRNLEGEWPTCRDPNLRLVRILTTLANPQLFHSHPTHPVAFVLPFLS